MIPWPQLDALSLTELFAQCQHERSAYSTAGVAAAPACVELVRRAFADDQTAWALFRQLFEPLIRAWIGVQQHVEPDDVVQEALFAFARWAPAHADLTAGDDLGRALAFLRQCTKTALLTQLRKHKQPTYSLDETPHAAHDDSMAAAERRLVIRERVAQLLLTAEEQVVFQELLVNGLKPQELFERYPEHFATIESLRVTIQRVLRRLRKDPDLNDVR